LGDTGKIAQVEVAIRLGGKPSNGSINNSLLLNGGQMEQSPDTNRVETLSLGSFN
jgi:hypothetical protein